jgi:hypothetical protein
MSDDASDSANDPLKVRKRALARWGNEGGAEPDGPQAASTSVEGEAPMPDNGAAEIAPRPGFTHHALTTRAAAHMNDLVKRATHFRDEKSS